MNLIETLSNSIGATFASFTYRSKSDNSLARYNVILGASYITLLEKSKLELELLIPDLATDMKPAAAEVMASLEKSIAAHNNGTQSDDYTKKGQYVALGNGLNRNSTDGTLQMFGLVQSKVVIEPGDEKKLVKSSPKTIAKNAIRKMLPVSKFREFAFDLGNIEQVKMNGNTIEFAVITPAVSK